MTSIPGWDCTKPGINTLDELHRALRDIQRLTVIWKRIARENADAWIEPREEKLKIRSELEIDARNNWSDWIKAVDRAHSAIDQADLARIDLSKSDLLKLVGRLNTLFPHSILSQSDGAHLLRGVHPLGSDNRGATHFPSEQVDRAFEAINEIVDVLILVAPRFADSSSGTDPIPIEWTKTQLYTAAKTSASTFDRIRIAAGIEPAGKGGSGQSRTYSQDELKRLINAAAGINPSTGRAFRNGTEIAESWSKMLVSHT